MKTNNIPTILIILSLIFTSCSIETIEVSSNDTVTYRDVDITDYSGVEIASDFNAYITFSDTEESIEIEANENLHQYIVAKKDGNKLIVRLKNNINVRGQETLNVYIKTKSITDFTVAAASKIYLQNVLIENYTEINVSADSFFSGEVQVDNLNLKLSADAKADLYGTVGFLNANLTADTELTGYDLHVEDLKIEMSADCEASLTVTNTIDIEASADCILRYKGNAAIIHQDLRTDSRIKKTD